MGLRSSLGIGLKYVPFVLSVIGCGKAQFKDIFTQCQTGVKLLFSKKIHRIVTLLVPIIVPTQQECGLYLLSIGFTG